MGLNIYFFPLKCLWATLSTLLQDLTRGEKGQSGPKLQRLDKVLDMSKAGAISSTIAFSEGGDCGRCSCDVCAREIGLRTGGVTRAKEQ